MTIQLFSNNAKTTLASNITSTQTTITVASGTGSQFPNPTTGQQFKVTLNSATSVLVYEICNCTARSGDTLTVQRGQEGTTALAFNTGDIVGHFDTAGVMTDLVQSEQYQANTYGYAVAGGTANALTATIPSNLTTVPDGMAIYLRASAPNTGACTLVLTLGSTVQSSKPIVKGNNIALASGDIPIAGYPISLVYSTALSAWVLTDIAVNLTTYAPLNSPAFTGTPTAPTPAINDNSTEIATTAYVQNNLANYAPIYSPTLTGTPLSTTPISTDNSTKIATTAYVKSQKYGLGITGETWHNVVGSRSLDVTYTNSYSYPIMVSVTCTPYPPPYIDVYGSIGIYVDGVIVGETSSTGRGSAVPCNMTVIVPAGSTYQAYGSNLYRWTELY